MPGVLRKTIKDNGRAQVKIFWGVYFEEQAVLAGHINTLVRCYILFYWAAGI
jgi:hypothetical protein